MISRFRLFLLFFCVIVAGLNAQTPPPSEILIGDEPTSSTWSAVRIQLPAELPNLRSLARGGGSSGQMTRRLDALQETLDEFRRVAQTMAIEEFPEIEAVARRAERLMDNLAADYDNGRDEEIVNTLRLLEESLNRLEELAFLSDMREGRLAGPPQSIYPPGWEDPKYAEEAVRTSLTLMTASDLVRLAEQRRTQLLRMSERRLSEDDEPAARELGEFARAMVLRQGEFPPLMRPGFRNSALRAEVIADNLVDYLRAGDRANYRRQLMILRDALRDLDSYIKVRDRMAEGE